MTTITMSDKLADSLRLINGVDSILETISNLGSIYDVKDRTNTCLIMQHALEDASDAIKEVIAGLDNLE